MEKRKRTAAAKMQLKKKMVIPVIGLVLLLCMAVGGTVAYLMDQTKSITNTFTYGDINIDLKETTGEEYKMMPGIEIKKDPMVTVEKGSEDCWLYVKLDKSENFDRFMTYSIADGWTALKGYDNIWYREIKAADVAAAKAEYPVLMDDKVTVKPTVTKEDFNALGEEYPTLTVTAYAIQRDVNQDALSTAEKAWIAIPVEAASAEDVKNALEAANNTEAPANVTLTENIESATGMFLKNNGRNSNLTMNFGENTFNVVNPVGSAGTETQAAHFEKGSVVLLKNGTLTSSASSVQMLIQNYGDLTIENMTLDGTKLGGSKSYVVSANNGNVLITGNTNITAKAGSVAIDAMYWVDRYPDGVAVIIDEHMTGTVDGLLQVYRSDEAETGTKGNYVGADGEHATLLIKGGTFKNTGLTLEQFSAFVANGYQAEETESGVYKVVKNR